MGEKSANNVISELNKPKIELSKFLHALGLERIEGSITVISQHFSSLHKLLLWVDEGQMMNLQKSMA